MICEIALALLLDGSASIQDPDWQTQVEQTARAIESPEVIDAVRRNGAIAVAGITFSDRFALDVDWQVVRTPEEVRALAGTIRRGMRRHYGMTDIGGALRFAQQQFANVPCQVNQYIVDLSTDGRDNEDEMAAGRDAVQEEGIRVNVIVVGDQEDEEALRRSAVTYDGFVLRADSWAGYPALFRRKIVLELTQALP